MLMGAPCPSVALTFVLSVTVSSPSRWIASFFFGCRRFPRCSGYRSHRAAGVPSVARGRSIPLEPALSAPSLFRSCRVTVITSCHDSSPSLGLVTDGGPTTAAAIGCTSVNSAPMTAARAESWSSAAPLVSSCTAPLSSFSSWPLVRMAATRAPSRDDSPMLLWGATGCYCSNYVNVGFVFSDTCETDAAVIGQYPSKDLK
ncbi:hypothetical protein PF005_g8222 [Phytophthora fragariae]|uniref:Uncharacterized protein n=2 Tax=Phytophthora fragariae TaxID=53985 RepID=A0A6A4AAJ3_9STRA|nr:hypothetical protein PF007_g8216 [Phytophthora fragariae]KAE9139223.1 hypothetical protein PF010_g674 [Phytophthora fragariae]KAE9218560.1 hypothetical protein PF005_g8222 [Phytophthora fragariae]KAE9240351.1 hypothetical protein PF004_g7558 [Phytophthora fragariae]KAE9255442.1 hypothetical protein PF002_g2342 [Phytophthora fragariae]